ncbi:MAG: hypothetical protein ACO3QS_08150 [Burkholderiaceae bacterium]
MHRHFRIRSSSTTVEPGHRAATYFLAWAALSAWNVSVIGAPPAANRTLAWYAKALAPSLGRLNPGPRFGEPSSRHVNIEEKSDIVTYKQWNGYS